MPRGVGLAVLATLALVAAVLLAGPEPDRPVAVVGHAVAPGAIPSTTAAPAPVRTSSPTTSERVAVPATRSTTVSRTGGGGVTVVNSGSQSVNTGGNTAVGPGSATVVNGPATAVGNSSTVVVSPP